jgi:uncharacterized protein (TIGR02246 family)
MLKTVCAASLICAALAATAAAAPFDEPAIRANVAAFEAAWNNRDSAGVVATYAPDGDVVVMDGARIAGHDEIRRLTEAELAKTPPTMRITLTVTSIRPITQDAAVVDTVARFNEGPVRENRGTSVFVLRGGKWLVAALRVYPAQGPPGR